MKATLIFPGITMGGWHSFGRMGDSDANFVPYGLAYIASYAKSKGHIIDALDLRRMNDWDEFEREIEKRSPGVFGISSMSVDFGAASEAIKIIKNIDRDSVTIVGGVHATVAFDDVCTIKEIDYIIKGEGEISFADLLERLEKGQKPQRVIGGVSPEIDSLPYPARDLFNYEAGEMRSPWLPHMPCPFAAIIASRGCPFKCTFCQPAERAIFGGRARMRSVDNVIEELIFLRDRYRFKSLLVHDDLFTFNREWVREFCKKYRQNGFDQIFTCQARADFIVRDEDVVKEMVETGLSCFMIGFESGSQRILDFIKKGITVEQNEKAVEVCRKYGIKIFANYMFGLPTETVEEVFATVEFIKWARPEYASPAFFTPHPGSDLYNYCIENNLSLINSYSSYARNPQGPKIKGVDYGFLAFAVEKSVDYKIDDALKNAEKAARGNDELFERANVLKNEKRRLRRLESFYREKYFGKRAKVYGGKKKVLVTGGTGFIGAMLIEKLVKKDYEVTVVTRNIGSPKAKYFLAMDIEIIQNNVEDVELLKKVKGFNVVFHLAISPESSGKKMFEVNVGGTENILRAAMEGGVESFVYASSIEAQGTGAAESVPLTEDHPCRPVSEYGKSKLEAEDIVKKIANEFSTNVIIARIGNVYGIGGHSFLYPMTEAILRENSLLTYLPLFKERLVQPIYIDDLVNIFLAVVQKRDGIKGTYNFTGNSPVTVGRWFEILGSFLGKEATVKEAMGNYLEIKSVETVKQLHPYISYFLSGDEPYIHRAYSDKKLRKEMGDYEDFNIYKGVAYTLDWFHKTGLLNPFIR